MSDNTLRPIWTPEDARQTARDAAQHVGIRGDTLVDDQPADPIPVAGSRDIGRTCGGCGAGPLEDCDPDCLRIPAGGLDCSLGMRPRRARRLTKAAIVVAVLVLVLTVGALWASSQSKAEPPGVKCVDQFWLIPFQSNRRTICDGPILPDGSWTRLREFYSPAHRVPLRTSCYGTYSFSCTTTGGYIAERTSNGIESYSVRPETVLADEPGHLA